MKRKTLCLQLTLMGWQKIHKRRIWEWYATNLYIQTQSRPLQFSPSTLTPPQDPTSPKICKIHLWLASILQYVRSGPLITDISDNYRFKTKLSEAVFSTLTLKCTVTVIPFYVLYIYFKFVLFFYAVFLSSILCKSLWIAFVYETCNTNELAFPSVCKHLQFISQYPNHPTHWRTGQNTKTHIHKTFKIQNMTHTWNLTGYPRGLLKTSGWVLASGLASCSYKLTLHLY